MKLTKEQKEDKKAGRGWFIVPKKEREQEEKRYKKLQRIIDRKDKKALDRFAKRYNKELKKDFKFSSKNNWL